MLFSSHALLLAYSSGIGLHTAKYLALRGAKVYFTARSKAKATAATADLLRLVPNIPKDNLLWLQLDLCDLRSIKQAVEELLSKEEKLNILSKIANFLIN